MIHQAICSTTYHSLPSFPLHFACLPVDLSWNINYVDCHGILIMWINKFSILGINQKATKDITKGILYSIKAIQIGFKSRLDISTGISCNTLTALM